MTALETHNEGLPMRPLHVLVPLIKQDLEAAEQAGEDFYRAAGEKLIEAKGQMDRGEFVAWIKRHFDKSVAQAQRYMRLARATDDMEKPRQRSFETLSKATGDHREHHQSSWHQPVREMINKAHERQENLRKAALTRAQEREAERKLGLELIAIGYKALATKFHPDKGGSRDAMARLNRVRDRLKHSA